MFGKKKEKEIEREEEKVAEPKAKPAAAAAADVIEAMGDGLIVTDLDGNIISVNKAMEEYLTKRGIDVKKFIGKSSLDLPTIRPEDIEKFAGLIREVMEKGRAGPLEVPDLTGSWNSFTVSLLKDADGNPTALFAVLRDVTELKRAEEERVAAMQERAAIVDGMPDALNVLDLDGRIVAVNPAYVKMFGWKPEEVIGKSVEDMSETFAKPEDLEYILKTMGEVIETGTAVKPVETLVLTKDGREVPISVTYSLIKDAEGNLKNLVTSIRDITELKRLQEKEKEVAVARVVTGTIEAMPDPLFLVDLDGVIIFTNPAQEKVFGRKSEDIVGKSFDQLTDAIRPEDIETFMKFLGKLVETGHAEPLETVIRAKDGREIPVSVAYSLIKDADGNPKNIIAVLRDITELKRLQEKEKAAAAENARAEEAEKYSKELEAKVKELEEFHDLAVGRELKMKKMEQEIEELKKRLEEKQ